MSRALLLILAAGAILAFAPAMAAQPGSKTIDVRVGTVGLTKACVSKNHILQRMGPKVAQRAKVTEMSEAAIYRALMGGKIDLGSVLALPEDVGIKDFEGAFTTPPRMMTLGHMAVSACVSSKRPLSRLTVDQIGCIISGEITNWRQLGAGEGKIKVMTDQPSLDLIAAVTGVKPAGNLRKIREGRKALEVVGDGGLVLTSSKLHELDFSKMTRVAMVPVADGEGKGVLPSLANIQDGSYPLARPWRLILRPEASETAAKIMSLLADVEKGGDFDPWLRLWLVHPAASPISDHIRVGSMGWRRELAAAAKAYRQKHPEITFTFSNDYLNVPSRLLRGEIDLANYTGGFLAHIGGSDYEKFGKGFPEPSIERTVGYWPFAVAVHPGNPMKSISVEQLRRLLSDPNARWGDIGRATDGRIRLYLYQASTVARVLSNDDGKPISLRGANKHKSGIKLPYRGIPDLSDDPDGIAVWYHDRKLAASGYRILPLVVGVENRPRAPTDTAAVASGDYPLRTPLKVLVRDSAPAHVKAFVDWLSTAEAAEAFKSGAEDSHSTRWPVAHVSEAAQAPSSMPTTQQAATRPSVGGFAGLIAGAVAVLPTEPLSLVFRMADRSHHAVYERAISEAIEADGRLKIVDRTQLSRVLDERRLQILGLDDAPARPIVSADVLLVSHVVTEDLKTFLRIRAVHGPTAGLLGELKLPINPADPATFDPPLEEAARRWWPDVLERLRDSREKPSWVLLDVYPAELNLLDRADALRKDLQESLAAERSIFAPGDSTLDEAQQEMLLRILGLASPSGGRFSPADDYLVDARLLEAGKLQMRLRNAAMKILAEETLSGDANALHSAANGWLKQQIAANPRRSAGTTMPVSSIDDWSRQQARAELEISRQLRSQAGWRYDKSRRRWDVPLTTPRDPDGSSALRAAADRHARRAAQLDPTNEEAAYEALPALQDLMENLTAGGENTMSLAAFLAPLERFLHVFPHSTHYEEVLYRFATACVYTGRRDRFPGGVDATIRLLLIRRGLDGYARYMELYRIEGKPSPDYQAVMCFAHYLYHLQKYIDLAEPSDKELDALVADWSHRFDSHTDKAVHSDFVRLIILKHKADRAGFIELLTKMQQRWPDPKHPQWAQTTGVVDGMIFSLFRGVESSNSSFQLWHRRLRGIGDIPKVGYKLENDKPRYRAMLLFAFPGEAAKVKDAVRQAGAAYKKIQPGVELRFLVSPKFIEAVESARYPVFVLGQLHADDLKTLKEIYRGKDLPLRRIGYLRGLAGSASHEVSILLPPGAGRNAVLDDFLRFLETPEGRKVLAEHGIHLTAGQPASQPDTQSAGIRGPDKNAPGE